jgi:hypothetical protein
LGLHEIAGPSVHFTGAYTAYGPIKPKSDKGIWYFTLRNGFDPGARFMAQPENRAALRTVPGRKHREAVAGPLTDADVGELFKEADGLGAWHHRLTAGEAITGPAPDTGRGQYWVVIGGTLEADGTALPRLSCVFVRPDEPAFTAKAGPDGLDVIAMQFPRHH